MYKTPFVHALQDGDHLEHQHAGGFEGELTSTGVEDVLEGQAQNLAHHIVEALRAHITCR